MNGLRGILTRLIEAVFPGRVERELDDEIEFHLEQETERFVRAGHSRAEARRRAELAFGPDLHVREQIRNESGFPWIESTLRDIRYGVRGLRRNPGFAAAAALTLALGIGATTAVFTVVDHVLLRPLPYPEADRLIEIRQQNSPTNIWNLSVADVQGIDELQTSMESFAALQREWTALTGRGRPEQILAGRASWNWFTTLGVQPAQGRGFVELDASTASPEVVVISHAFRARTFEATEDPLGQAILLDGIPHTIVGVLGPQWSTLAGYRADVWPILRLDTPTRRGPFFLKGVGRLRPDATLATARADLDQLSQTLFPRWADGFRDQTARLTPFDLRGFIVGDSGSTLWFVLASVVGVLLIAVTNVANLLMVRATARRAELSLRAALGASSGRIAKQLVTESLVLAAVGGLAGLAVAWGGLELFKALGPQLPRLDQVALDGRILAVSAVVTLTTAVVFGLVPLLDAPSASPSNGLGGERGAGSGSGRMVGRLRSALVAGEFAIAFPILAAAALFASSLAHLTDVDPGYDPTNLVSAQIALPEQNYGGYDEVQEFWRETLRRLEERPEVSAAGVGTALPPQAFNTNNFDLVVDPVPEGESEPVAVWNGASPSFFQVLDIPLLEGRLYDESDADGDPVAVVSRSWADRFAADRDPVGLQFYSGGDRSQPVTVIGVVGDVKFNGLDASDDAAVYEPFTQSWWGGTRVIVRTRGSAEDAVTGIREVVAALDPGLPLSQIETMEVRLRDSVAEPRRWTVLLGLFSALGLTLSAIGAYGVLSFFVGRQSRELGIRMALGATPASVRQLVLQRGLGLAAVGTGFGLLLALIGTRWIRSLVFGVSPTDPVVLGLVTFSLLGVALVACLLPAIRATRIDPIEALRAE